ncbi:reverse transcriptase domain-containing protein [Tanacetum coccineum]
MVGRRRTRNVNQLHEELDPRDIEVNELRQLVQQLQLRLERVEAPRQNYTQKMKILIKNTTRSMLVVAQNLFIDHIHTVERVFDYQEVRDALKVKIVSIKLKKHASVWWEQLKLERAHENKPRIRTWEKIKQELRKKFLPDWYLQEAFLQLHDFTQCDLSVADYTEKFDHLKLKYGIGEPRGTNYCTISSRATKRY